MASQKASAGRLPTAQLVANVFVHQYYRMLHQSPELVYLFYQDSSKLGRPHAQEAMSSITTMQAINEKILSMDYGEFRSEIKTVDAQDSLNGGILVLATGHLISKDNAKRSFTQSFFLSPQRKGGYYVLNDIFRYVEEVGRMEGNTGVVSAESEAAHGAAPTPNEEPAPIQENHVTEQAAQLSEEDLDVEKTYEHSEEEISGLEEEVVIEEVVDEIQGEPAAAADSSSTLEEAPKKPYASILKLMKENAAPLPVSGPPPIRPSAPTPERVVAPLPAPTPVAEVSASSSNAAESITSQEAEAADGHSIYIKGLPLNATPSQLEEEFKRFGPIKSGGVQVRSNKVSNEPTEDLSLELDSSPINLCSNT